VISCTTIASVAAAGSSVFTFTTDAIPAVLAGVTLTNSATVGADPGVLDPAAANNTDTDADTVVDPVADLAMSKDDGVVNVNVGGTLTYTMTVSNAGPNASGTGITVSDTLPLNVTVNGGAAGAVALGGADAADWTCTSDAASPQVISCTTIASIAAAGSSVFTFTTDAIPAVLAGVTLTNSATVGADPGVLDPAAGNNTDTDADTVVDPVADLAMSKDDGVVNVNVGGPTRCR
jgi:uncharacterized repeat protein (TIGR01451 family)